MLSTEKGVPESHLCGTTLWGKCPMWRSQASVADLRDKNEQLLMSMACINFTC